MTGSNQHFKNLGSVEDCGGLEAGRSDNGYSGSEGCWWFGTGRRLEEGRK